MRLKMDRAAGAGAPLASWLLASACAAILGFGYLFWPAGVMREGAAEAQTAQAHDPAEDGRDTLARNEKARTALAAAEAALTAWPPAVDPSARRLEALGTLDSVLQQPDAAALPAVREYFHRRIASALAEMRRAQVDSGALVWHIYNHGFVVRTVAATACFDLVRPRYLRGFGLDQGTVRQLVEQCDVLFVSHYHGDHAETLVAQSFVETGKPVVAPPQVRYRQPLYGRVTHLAESAEKVHSLPLREGATALRVVVFPGHQGNDVNNNVVLVMLPDGITLMHTGDQWSAADFKWIDRVGANHRVDILLANDWAFDIARLVRGVNPALVIPGHANELGHEVSKRQPFVFSYERKAGSARFYGSPLVGYPQPLVVLSWGESFRYRITGFPRR